MEAADSDDPDNEIQVYIGDETPVQSMKDCSIVTANYALGDGMRGTIGIVGPKGWTTKKSIDLKDRWLTQLNETFNKQQ